MRRERPHIVHTHTGKAGLLGRTAARLSNVPIVIHTYHGHVFYGYYSPAKSWLARRVEKVMARITDKNIAISDEIKRDLLAYGIANDEDIDVIPLGVDLDPFLVSGNSSGNFRSELGLEPDTYLIGIVGRIVPIKNHRLFLDAAANVVASGISSHFAIVGDGEMRADIERYTHDLGLSDRVTFTGWRSDLPDIYTDLDALVISSDNEGTPVSVIEGMASGCAVVATRVGGLVDLLKHEETGFLVDPQDAKQLSEGILRVLSDSDYAHRIGQAATAAVREQYALDRLVSETQQLYEQFLNIKGLETMRQPPGSGA